jgi:hypothetical protein
VIISEVDGRWEAIWVQPSLSTEATDRVRDRAQRKETQTIENTPARGSSSIYDRQPRALR